VAQLFVLAATTSMASTAGEGRTTGLAIAVLLVAGRRQCRCDSRPGEDVRGVVFGVSRLIFSSASNDRFKEV
jgi:hypothetical protein